MSRKMEGYTMITYLMNVRMADPSIKIDDKVFDIISECTVSANNTVVSRREKRSYEVISRNRDDENAIIIKLTTKNPVNPTRSLSTLSRKVLDNEYMSSILEGHTPNGSVFKSELIDADEDSNITYKSDPEIVSEIISIFFDNTMLPKEKELASDTAENIRSVVLKYINNRNSL